MRLPDAAGVAVGGAVGALARVSVTTGARHQALAVLTVNLVGCAVVGVLAARLAPASAWRPLLLTGLLGGWTTWSGVAVLVTGLGAVPGAALLVASLLLGPAVTAAVLRLAERRPDEVRS